MRERPKLIAGIALLIQSVSMFILFLTQLRRRRGLAAAFFAISAVGALFGAKLLGDLEDDEETDGETEDGEPGDADGDGIDDDLVFDGDMMKSDLGHGTDDEEQSTL